MSPGVSFRRASAADDGLSSSLPRELLEPVRGRIRLLALFILFAFGLDLVIGLSRALTGGSDGVASAPASGAAAALWINLGTVVVSAALVALASRPTVPPARLHAFGLVYEVVICCVIATMSYWQHFTDTGVLPNLTWVPVVVILFPLILPGPPRRMLVAACAAAAAVPAALLVLAVIGAVSADGEAYVQAVVSSGFAVGFAYLGARTVYGLGRQVAEARELGSYILQEKLGEGGMGEVWQARHRLLARPAAVKLIGPAALMEGLASSDAARRRFEREAQATAQLRSPHTVELFDFGVASDGTFYYVMELLDGVDASALVRRFGPVPAARAVHLLQQLCHSLSEAETRGLVHRDIKPANVFICRYGEDCDFVKVLDFGLVKGSRATSASAETAPAVTREGVLAGTPAFMAPEQATGSRVDARADIYAVGGVAYWLLTGRQVFEADTPLELVLHHARTVPAAPSTRTELPIPPALDELVLSCLAKAPEERPQSARDLAARLAEIEAGSWTDADARRWWDHHLPDHASAAT